jgi:hypothetical protein
MRLRIGGRHVIVWNSNFADREGVTSMNDMGWLFELKPFHAEPHHFIHVCLWLSAVYALAKAAVISEGAPWKAFSLVFFSSAVAFLATHTSQFDPPLAVDSVEQMEHYEPALTGPGIEYEVMFPTLEPAPRARVSISRA